MLNKNNKDIGLISFVEIDEPIKSFKVKWYKHPSTVRIHLVHTSSFRVHAVKPRQRFL